MPASYAHYRFGKQLLSGMNPELSRSIQRFRRLYDMGLHGPDIFFYHNPLMKTAAGQLGHAFHAQTGQEFFTRVCAQAGTEAARAYLCGLLAHYCLDSVCHPYVGKMVDNGSARHVELETEFDRYLLEADGEASPHTYDGSRHMKLTRGECVTVANFYPPATPANVNLSVHNMARATRFLAGKNRKRLERLLRVTNNQAIEDQLMPGQGDDRWKWMDSEMLVLYNRALKRYPILLEQITAHMRTGEPLGEDFAPTFG
ncbi:MAG: zinc dependent phospholipase C family protein [Faecousia sp.]